MARKYTRDNRGRFASVGATARGGRLKTAGGGRRQAQTMRAQAPGLRSNTIAKGGNGVRGSVARSLAAVKREKTVKGSEASAQTTSPGRKTYRTKRQAAAAYRERVRRTKEYAMSAPGMSSEWQRGPRSITRTKIKVDQGNLLTGRTEKVTTNVKTKQSDQSRIGQSAASRNTQRKKGARVGVTRGLVAMERGKVGAAKAPAAPAKPVRRKKTDTEIMWQAGRIISKNNKIAARAISNMSTDGYQKTMRTVHRTIRRSQYLVPLALERRGLLDEYARRTASADDFLRIPKGPGLKPPRRRR